MSRAGGELGLLAELTEVVGRPDCVSDPEVTSSFTTDWTRRYSGTAAAVVRPADTSEVAEVLRTAGRHNAAVVAQGGNTGLVGGGVPRARAPKATDGSDRLQLVVSLTRLSGVSQVDTASRVIEAGAGTTLAQADQAAHKEGFHLGIDLGARESATLGGMVATNAGGLHVFRYGSMRSRLVGLEAVLADGTVVSQTSGFAKDSAGPDIAATLAGSEGTLALVTKVLARLEPVSPHRVVALLGVSDMQRALDLVHGPLRALPSLEAAELTLADGMRLVREHAGLPAPPGLGAGATAWITVEAAAETDPTDDLARALDGPGVIAAAAASDEATRKRLWAYRELHAEAVATRGITHKLDVSVRPARLGELVTLVTETVSRVSPTSELYIWGHVADGNLHVNVVGPEPSDYAVDDAVLRLVGELGGSISAEHGIGVAKNRWLSLSRDEGSLAAMARVKEALDPAHTLNPGVLDPSYH